jgi:PAS domain S-box-containing protein
MNNARRQERTDKRIEELEARLHEAEETLRAIRNGEVDALVISAAEGEQIYTLKTAEHPYRILVEAMSEGAATLDEAGTVLYCNGSFARILNTPSERVLGTTFGDLVVPDDRSRYETLLHQSRKKNAKGEVRMTAGGDREVDVLISLSPLTLEDVSGISVVLTDLSEQKRQQHLIASEKLLRSILEQASEAMIVCDPQGRIIHASLRAHQLCACNPALRDFDEMLLLHWERESTDSAAERLGISFILHTREIRGLEVSYLRPDGMTFDLLLSSGAILDSHGDMMACVISLVDITDRKRSEKNLQFQSLVLGQINDAVIAIDNQEHVTYANDAAERQYGFTASDAIGRPLEELYRYGWEGPELEISARNTLDSTGLWRGENLHIRPDGKTLNVESVVSTLRGKGNTVTGVLGVIRDVTERKRVEAALYESEARLRAIFDGTYEFIGLLSPDGNLLEANRASLKWIDTAREDVIGKPFWETPWWTNT